MSTPAAEYASEYASYRAKVASLTRSRAHDDPELVAARAAMQQTKFWHDIVKVVDTAPTSYPPEVLDQIHDLLWSGRTAAEVPASTHRRSRKGNK